MDQSACIDAKNSQPYTLENQGLEANNGDLEDPDFNWVIFRFHDVAKKDFPPLNKSSCLKYLKRFYETVLPGKSFSTWRQTMLLILP